jgi:hypothetical protein
MNYVEKKENEVVLFSDDDIRLEVNVSPGEDTVWLSQNQMSELFDVNRPAITKHIGNIFKSGELDKDSVSSILEHTASDGKVYSTNMYNLDVIISVGYRVNTSKGIKFRKWATDVLKQFAIKGIVMNQSKFDSNTQLQLIEILKRTTPHIESHDILSVLERYTKGLTLLDDYDHQRVTKPEGSYDVYRLEYEECRRVVDQMRFYEDTGLFGREREGLFKSSIGAIYQSFDGKDVYPSVEEKTANLLYLLRTTDS